ncbi:MAG TPA: DUF1573 domain-containing protein [Chitinophagaceae bacterium]|nr:DUF1573 domain-containing protein [Chitinophagaceae bacterium]
MKKILMLLPAIFVGMLLHAQDATSTSQQAPAPPDVTKYVDFKETDHDFGKIPQGKPAEFDLMMKNISSEPIKIENVQVGCGCTTPKYEHGPYAPGETFKVTVGYNASAQGPFTKVITIFFNDGMSKIIRFHGETFPVPANAAPANAAVQQLKPATTVN